MLKNNFFTLIIVVVLLVASSVYLYGTNFQLFLKNHGNVTPTPTAAPNVKIDEFTITGSSFRFIPNQITVTKGDKVKITFKDTDGPHNLTIPDFHIATKVLNAGQQATVEFVADKSGTFEFHCSYGHHKEFGMIGKLIVQ